MYININLSHDSHSIINNYVSTNKTIRRRILKMCIEPTTGTFVSATAIMYRVCAWVYV